MRRWPTRMVTLPGKECCRRGRLCSSTFGSSENGQTLAKASKFGNSNTGLEIDRPYVLKILIRSGSVRAPFGIRSGPVRGPKPGAAKRKLQPLGRLKGGALLSTPRLPAGSGSETENANPLMEPIFREKPFNGNILLFSSFFSPWKY